jgi:hypothetical protein
MMLMALCPTVTSAQQTLEEATDSIKNILTLAKQGDAVAQNEVGGWYYRGRHVTQNYEEALQWWAKSAKQGNVQAIGNMGLCYQTGHGITADSLKASQLYQKSIKNGNSALFKQHVELAQDGKIFSNMLIASCYQNGIGVTKSNNDAIQFLSNAANQNCVSAQRDLALLLLNNKKTEAAAQWFKKASDNGDISSTFYYGKMLFEGLGVKADKKDGANYLLRAAEADFPQAMYYVGNCYMNGDGLTKNAEQAVKWYKLAAGKRNVHAQWALAQCYRTGNGTPINFDQAIYWYAESLSKGYSRAFKQLITDTIPGSPFASYAKGIKAYHEKDYDTALKYFKGVEKSKITDGKVMEAAIMANNAYAKHNIKKGIKLLNDASKTNAQAMYLLGALYEAGKGVDKDMVTAVDYITKAANMGYSNAECALADMYFEGRGVDQNYETAVAWYAKAYEQGQLTENATNRYASCYENGWGGLEINKDKSAEILKSYKKAQISQLLELI